MPPSGKNFCTRSKYFTTCNCVFNFNFLVPVVSEIIGGFSNLHSGALRPQTSPSGKILTHPQVLACTYVTVKFQRCSSINVRLTEGSLCIRFRIGVILGVVGKIFGGKVHSCSELRVFRYLWSRSDAPCSSIMYGYSHLP